MIVRFGIERENGRADYPLAVPQDETRCQIRPDRLIEPGVHDLHDVANRGIPDRVKHERAGENLAQRDLVVVCRGPDLVMLWQLGSEYRQFGEVPCKTEPAE